MNLERFIKILQTNSWLMKVLFVSSGNSVNGISPIIKNQGNSLIDQGIEVDFFTIKGKGLKGYLKNIPRLKTYIKNNNIDIIHAHYSKSAFAASLAGGQPLVVSLMGSDVKSNGLNRYIIKFFQYFFWDKTIVKSDDMKESLNFGDIKVVPNGVDFRRFKPIPKINAEKLIHWESKRKHILFAANPKRKEKNFEFARRSFNRIKSENIQLHYLNDVSNETIPLYHNAADAVLLTSLWEGSPNVIKEAMACNIPIVSTDVGDVREVIGKTDGCYITTFEPEDVASKIQQALDFGKRTTGREDIKHLESSIIAKKIIEIYKSVMTKY